MEESEKAMRLPRERSDPGSRVNPAPSQTTLPRRARKRTTVRRTVALIPDAPAGAVFTRAAGLAKVKATLQAKTPINIQKPIIRETTFAGESRAYFSRFSQKKGEEGLVIEGEVTAFDEESLGRAVESVMRRICEAAAMLDAVLEMRVAREARPRVASEGAVCGLVRDLTDAGFPVFTEAAEVLRSSAPDSDVWLGVGGAGENGGSESDLAESLRAFLEAHPGWELV